MSSKQAFALFPKIKEVRELNDIPGAFGFDSQGFAVPESAEAHPEVSFWTRWPVNPMRLCTRAAKRVSSERLEFPA